MGSPQCKEGPAGFVLDKAAYLNSLASKLDDFQLAAATVDYYRASRRLASY